PRRPPYGARRPPLYPCEYQDRHNVDAELPLLLLKCRRLGTPLWKSRTRAPGLLPTRDTIWGAQGFRVRLTDGLARTKITPTSVPTAQRQPTQNCHPFHILRVGNFGGGLTGKLHGCDLHQRQWRRALFRYVAFHRQENGIAGGRFARPGSDPLAGQNSVRRRL